MENLAEGSVGNNLSQQTGISAFKSPLRGWFGALIFLGLCLHSIYAQSISGTLTGIVTDPSGAVVPQAKVSLKNEGSGDLRRTVSNADGFFTFAAVPAGTYEVSIEAAGFLTYQVSGLNLQAAERRNLDVTMKVGSTTETVSVSAAADVLVPVDSGEICDPYNKTVAGLFCCRPERGRVYQDHAGLCGRGYRNRESIQFFGREHRHQRER